MDQTVVRVLLLVTIACAGISCSGTETAIEAPNPAPRVHPSWIKTYTSFGRGHRFHSIQRTADNGFIVAGKAMVQDKWMNASAAAALLKLDAGGNIQWQFGYGKSPEPIAFRFARQTADGGYLALGNANWRGMVIKLDANGAVQWQQLYQDRFFRSFAQLPDGGFVMTGSSSYSGTGQSVMVSRLGPDGQSLWQKAYGPGEGRVVRPAQDGGFLVLDYRWDSGRDNSRVIKLDAAGGGQWVKHYRGELAAAEPMDDGGVMLAGTIGMSRTGEAGPPFGSGPHDVPDGHNDINNQGRILRLDSGGRELWQSVYGGRSRDDLTALKRTGDGMFLVLGNTRNFGAMDGDLWLLKIDGNGAIIWQRTIGGPKLELAGDLETTPDGGAVIAATTEPVLLKVDGQGMVPECTLALFRPTDAVPLAGGTGTAAAGDRPGPAVQDVPSQQAEAPALMPEALHLAAASFCPPEPKILMTPHEVRSGPYTRKLIYRTSVYTSNVGPEVLTVSKAEIQQQAPPDNKLWYYLARAWEFITFSKVYTMDNVCAEVKPDTYCTSTLVFRSSFGIDRYATLTLSSNDPDTPRVSVPIVMIAQ